MTRLLALVLAVTGYTLPACAWWCEGHEAVALIAENHLTPDARAQVERLLKGSPVVEPPSCKDSPADAIAIASTWADDAKDTQADAWVALHEHPHEPEEGRS